MSMSVCLSDILFVVHAKCFVNITRKTTLKSHIINPYFKNLINNQRYISAITRFPLEIHAVLLFYRHASEAIHLVL